MMHCMNIFLVVQHSTRRQLELGDSTFEFLDTGLPLSSSKLNAESPDLLALKMDKERGTKRERNDWLSAVTPNSDEENRRCDIEWRILTPVDPPHLQK